MQKILYFYFLNLAFILWDFLNDNYELLDLSTFSGFLSVLRQTSIGLLKF